jgi:short-subunit dehydrogenase
MGQGGGKARLFLDGQGIVNPLVFVCSKAAMNSLVAGLRAELEVTGHTVSLSVLVLGLIGTDSNVNRGDELASRTMPVAECSSEMMCAIDSRMQTAFIPQMLSPYSTLIHFFPQLSTPLLQAEYLSAKISPPYVS